MLGSCKIVLEMPLDLTLNLGSTFLDNLSMKLNEVLLQMAKIDDDLTALKAAVDANTTATTAVVAAVKAGGVTAAQLAEIESATTGVGANTAAINAALGVVVGP
jgi:hypothetical protein